MEKTLVTGVAGFIGFHVSRRLLERGDEVVGVDNLSDYYDIRLKEARLQQLTQGRFRFLLGDLSDRPFTRGLFEGGGFSRAVHLAAQPGVRYSVECPEAYIDSNLVAFANLLEGCRHSGVGHLVYASSSSVYGANAKLPFSVTDGVDHPVSLYAATKKANELMAHAYSHIFGLSATGLRFFTVYGPWGRPDMAYYKFVRSILEDRPIDVYNHGRMARDFTYVDDIVEGVVRVLERPAASDPQWNPADPSPGSSSAPHRLYNIGSNRPVALMRFIEVIEQCLDKKARIHMMPMQAGDVVSSHADVSDLFADFGYSPSVRIEEGVRRFVDWYRCYYGV